MDEKCARGNEEHAFEGREHPSKPALASSRAAPLNDERSVADERRPLLVECDPASAAADLEREVHASLDDPDEGQERERERGPADERGVVLAREDRPERPRDRDARGQVALGRRERVRRRRRLEEEAVQGDGDGSVTQ